jgi:Tol biopolymer transport system component
MTRLLALLSLLVRFALGSQAAAQEPPIVNLTNHPARDWHPTWSPDGTQIAFMSDRNTTSQDIWIVPATGGQAVQLPGEIVTLTMDAPAWSPNGDVIAFHHDRPFACASCSNITVFTVPGGDSDFLTNCCMLPFFSNFDPAWSPDGSQIVFYSNRVTGSAFNLFVMMATGEPPAPTQITFDEEDGNTDPAWSPDNSQIVFVKGTFPNVDLWLVPAAGGPTTQLTDFPTAEYEPTWSPDGTQIAFRRADDIWVIPAAGGPVRQLTTHPAWDGYPSWSPDGTKIAFTSHRSLGGGQGNPDIWVMDLSTTAVELAPVAPAQMRLLASPNPFRDVTTISVVGMESGGTLRVVDVAGRLVREIAAPIAPTSGTLTLVWDGRNGGGLPVAPGTYFLTLESGSQRATGRLVRDR